VDAGKDGALDIMKNFCRYGSYQERAVLSVVSRHDDQICFVLMCKFDDAVSGITIYDHRFVRYGAYFLRPKCFEVFYMIFLTDIQEE
jgi:hypothetical protein